MISRHEPEVLNGSWFAQPATCHLFFPLSTNQKPRGETIWVILCFFSTFRSSSPVMIYSALELSASHRIWLSFSSLQTFLDFSKVVNTQNSFKYSTASVTLA